MVLLDILTSHLYILSHPKRFKKIRQIPWQLLLPNKFSLPYSKLEIGKGWHFADVQLRNIINFYEDMQLYCLLDCAIQCLHHWVKINFSPEILSSGIVCAH